MPYSPETREALQTELHALDPELTLPEPEDPAFPEFLAHVHGLNPDLANRLDQAVPDTQEQEARDLFAGAARKGNLNTVLGNMVEKTKGNSVRGEKRLRPTTLLAGAGGLLLLAVLVTAIMPDKKKPDTKPQNAVTNQNTPNKTTPTTPSKPQTSKTADVPSSTAPIPHAPASSSTPSDAAPAPITATANPTPVTSAESAPTPTAPITASPPTPVPSDQAPLPFRPITAADESSTPSTIEPSTVEGLPRTTNRLAQATRPSPVHSHVVTLSQPKSLTAQTPRLPTAPVPLSVAVVHHPAATTSSATPGQAIVNSTPGTTAPTAPANAIVEHEPAVAPVTAAAALAHLNTAETAPSTPSRALVFASESSSASTSTQQALTSSNQEGNQSTANGLTTSSTKALARATDTPPTGQTAFASTTSASGSLFQPGSLVPIVLDTGVALAPGATQYVWAHTADGSIWRGQASMNSTNDRLLVHFTNVLVNNNTLGINADLESSDGQGVGGRIKQAPRNAVQTAINAVLASTSDFVKSQAAQTTTYTPSGLVMQSQQPQNFWLSLGGGLANAFTVPATTTAIVPFGQLRAGETFQVRVDLPGEEAKALN